MKSSRLAVVILALMIGLGGLALALPESAKAVIPPRARRLLWFLRAIEPVDGRYLVAKLTYSDATRSKREVTFERGERVYVAIQLYEPESERTVSVTDRVFNFERGSVASFSFEKADGSTAPIEPEINEDAGELKFGITVAPGVNRVLYEYEMGE